MIINIYTYICINLVVLKLNEDVGDEQQVAALLFATGVGAGFGLTVEAKIYLGKDFKELDDFLDKILISTGFLLGATITLSIIVLLKK